MSKERIVCPHCGALQTAESDVCELCGSAVIGELEPEPIAGSNEASQRQSAGKPKSGGKKAGSARRAGTGAEAVAGAAVVLKTSGFCTHCGSPYPAGAKFCGACGEKLQSVTEPPEETHEMPESEAAGDSAPDAPVSDKELGRQILIVVGAGILLVVGLFFVTVASQDATTTVPTATSLPGALSASAAPLSSEAAARAAELREDIERLSGTDRRARQIELAEFYISLGRLELSGEVQEQIAIETGHELDWVRAGNLYYDWMEQNQGSIKTEYAVRAVAAYQKALEINPDNLDVRTDMAIAFMFHPDQSMEAIAQTNVVLEANPNHIQANFNRGIMLLQINRFDEAASQFEKVKQLVGDPQNEIYQRAESALDALGQLTG